MNEICRKVPEIDQEALDSISARKSRIGIAGESDRTQNLKVKVGGMVGLVSTLIARSVNLRNSNASLTSDQVEQYLSTLIVWRVQQLSGSFNAMNSCDVPVPEFFNPVLSSIGTYEDPMRYVEIQPVLGDIPNTLSVDEVRNIAWTLKASGMRCQTGLPKLKRLSDDAIFRVELKGNLLCTAGDDPGDLILLMRTMINIEYAKSLYGESRTRYLTVEDTYLAWETIVSRAIV